MIKLVFLISVLLLLHLRHSSCLIQRIPLYLGRGYDLLTGNPKTNLTDSGFRESLFQFSYANRANTEDGRFIIPDGAYALDSLDSCSIIHYESRVYTGTREYQKQLQRFAQAYSDESDLILNGSFTGSNAFREFKESKDESDVYIESCAMCELYTIDMFSMRPRISTRFYIRMLLAFSRLELWSNFMSLFGTHYVASVVYGSHECLRFKLTKAAYQDLRSANLDLLTIARLTHAKRLDDVKTDWQWRSQAIDAFEQRLLDEKIIRMGVKASGRGNWKDAVIERPVPIKYLLKPLTSLFTKDNFELLSDRELDTARTEFDKSVDDYCRSTAGCVHAAIDLPLPGDIKIKTTRTELYGVDGGIRFEDEVNTVNTILSTRKVVVRADEEYIYSIQLYLSDSIDLAVSTVQRGSSSHGTMYEWNVPDDQFIEKIEFQFNSVGLNSIKFTTDSNVESIQYGTQTGQVVKIKLTGHLVGIYGYSGKFINKIGFISNMPDYD